MHYAGVHAILHVHYAHVHTHTHLPVHFIDVCTVLPVHYTGVYAVLPVPQTGLHAVLPYIRYIYTYTGVCTVLLYTISNVICVTCTLHRCISVLPVHHIGVHAVLPVSPRRTVNHRDIDHSYTYSTVYV